MHHWFFLSIKYQIWPLPKDPAELRRLAIDLQIPRKHYELNTTLIEGITREWLKSLRKDILYVLLLLLPIFAIAILAVLLVQMAVDYVGLLTAGFSGAGR